jgi:hypothetical protein
MPHIQVRSGYREFFLVFLSNLVTRIFWGNGFWVSKDYVHRVILGRLFRKRKFGYFEGSLNRSFSFWNTTGGTMLSMSPPNLTASLMMEELVKIHLRPVMRKTV